MSEVFFTDFHADRGSKNVPSKIENLFRESGMASTFEKEDLVAIKTHFGEVGNTTYLRPQFVAQIADLVSESGGRPFLTDCNTLYLGGRADAVNHLWTAARHGFFPPAMRAPVIIADGLTGQDHAEIKVDLKHFKTVKIGVAAHHADSIIAVSHVKGHPMTGFGGALKNVGMGFGSRAGKLAMHHNIRPKVKAKFCKGCGECAKHCPAGAITLSPKARIDSSKCIGCGECYTACFNKAITEGKLADNEKLQERIVEYAYGVISEKKDRVGFINFLVDFTPNCDCYNWSDAPLAPNIGILASKDIVAIDQASMDLVNSQSWLSKGKERNAKDKVRALHGVDWTVQTRYAESIGLGSRKYELVKLRV